jgi:hypothetical protein
MALPRRCHWACLAFVALVGCKSKPTGRGVGSVAPPKPLAPLAAAGWLVDLDVPGFGKANVAIPLGATASRPVVIALHGGADRPEWACGEWVGVMRSHPFVLCPRGVKVPGRQASDPRYGWSDDAAVEKELRAALRALKARFGKYVASGPVLLAAFSAGVVPAAQIAKQEPKFFSRVVFVGPPPDFWSAGLAGVFAHGGGERFMIVCTDPGCRRSAESAFVFSKSAGVYAKLLEPAEYGRVLDARVTDAIGKELPWLLNGAPFWPTFAAAPAGSAH